MTGAALATSPWPKTMERQEDALNKLWEQSISYNGTINFTLANGEQRMQVFIFVREGRKHK